MARTWGPKAGPDVRAAPLAGAPPVAAALRCAIGRDRRCTAAPGCARVRGVGRGGGLAGTGVTRRPARGEEGTAGVPGPAAPACRTGTGAGAGTGAEAGAGPSTRPGPVVAALLRTVPAPAPEPGTGEVLR
ncbi:hypothetical protein [Streptomyces sp. NPDC001770]